MRSNIDKIIPGDSKRTKRPKSCKDIQKSVFLIILAIQLFFTIKLRINTIKSPIPIKAKEKVSKKDNPIINVLILEEIFWTISEELDGLCTEK
jgi:hypothetical protein